MAQQQKTEEMPTCYYYYSTGYNMDEPIMKIEQ